MSTPPLLSRCTPNGIKHPQRLSSQLAQVLTDRIGTGQLQPGEKLPTEISLMSEHGVSRTVVREAISQLSTRGLVVTLHGRGSFVSQTPLSPSQAPQESLEDLIAVIELRISIEVEAAGFAAQRRTSQHLERMAEALAILANPDIGRDAAAAADHEFHRQIALATGNRYFVDITHYFGTELIPRKRVDSAALDGTDRATYDQRLHGEHQAIHDSIAYRDPIAARAAMHIHLSNIRERLRQAR